MQGKEFRALFRVPYAIFLEILDRLRGDLRVDVREKDCVGRNAAPLSMKILSALHVLGHNTTFGNMQAYWE
jgi:hypothetical protein